jgi:hypothetical protein
MRAGSVGITVSVTHFVAGGPEEPDTTNVTVVSVHGWMIVVCFGKTCWPFSMAFRMFRVLMSIQMLAL